MLKSVIYTRWFKFDSLVRTRFQITACTPTWMNWTKQVTHQSLSERTAPNKLGVKAALISTGSALSLLTCCTCTQQDPTLNTLVTSQAAGPTRPGHLLVHELLSAFGWSVTHIPSYIPATTQVLTSKSSLLAPSCCCRWNKFLNKKYLLQSRHCTDDNPSRGNCETDHEGNIAVKVERRRRESQDCFQVSS